MSTHDRLNERPIYLRSVFLMLAFCQTGMHVYSDKSSVHIPVSAPTKNPAPDNRTHKLVPISKAMQNAIPNIIQRCAVTSTVIAATGPFIYALFLRQTFWSWHLKFTKLVYSLPRSDARPTGYPPSNPRFMLHSFGVGFLLMLTWEMTSFWFSTFLSQEPLKKDQPLSTGGKDPNGTLITGLKANRDLVKTFAFWELVMIAQKFPERRKVIFADIGREDGQAWGQMLSAALDVVQGVNTRIEAAATKPKSIEKPHSPDAMEIDSLPSIAPAIQEKPIFAKAPPPQTRAQEIEAYIDWGAKRIGQSNHPFEPPISKWREMLRYVTPAGISTEDLTLGALGKYLWSHLQVSPIGWFFRTSFERQVNTVILGSPYGSAAVVVDAIEAMTRILVASLSEDIYGKAISGVPSTVRLFTSTINVIETFVQNVKEEPTEDTDIEEVETILARLKAGLAELLSAFQLYLTDQGLSAADHRQAQNASASGRLLPERRQRRKEKIATAKAHRKELEVQHDEVKAKKDVSRKGVEAEKGKGNTREKEKEEEREKEREKEKRKEKGRVNGERRPQKRLEPQDPTRKKLFQDTLPKNFGRREMEMVR